MVALRISGPAGTIPRTHKRFLKPNEAQLAENCQLTSGACEVIRLGASGFATVAGSKTIYRYTDAVQFTRWLFWPKDVDVVRGPLASPQGYARLYWTGDNEPRWSRESDLSAGVEAATKFVLGVYPPSIGPTLGTTGGSGALETRVYVYTFINSSSEESQPSPPTTVVGFANATSWDISGLQAFPANTFAVSAASWSFGIATYTVSSTFGLRIGEELNITGFTPSGYNVRGPIVGLSPTTILMTIASNPGTMTVAGSIARIAQHDTTSMKRRIYRTVQSASGEAEYRFVADTFTTSYTDTISNAIVALTTLLPSTEWAMPPADGVGLALMPNGIMVMGSKNEILFSEPFLPHAWPTRYRQVVKGCTTVIGLGVFGTTVVACTDGPPNYITGVEPVTMGGGAQAIDEQWPCLSKRAIISTAAGVFYPTQYGLALVGPNGPVLVTRDLWTENEWRLLVPTTMIGTMWDGKIMLAYSTDSGATYSMLSIDKTERLGVVRHAINVGDIWTDPTTGILYISNETAGAIQIFGGAGGSSVPNYDWWSGESVLPAPMQFGAARVDADFSSAVSPTLTFKLYSEGVLKFTKTVTNNRPFTLPKGFKIEFPSVRLTGNVRWTSIVLGGTIQELRAG